MRVLFLDDDPARRRQFGMANIGHAIDYASTAIQAIGMLAAHDQYDVASLDHDLDPYATMGQTPRDPTGYDVVQAMIETPALRAKLPKLVLCHSCRESAAEKMAAALREAGVRAYVRPFDPSRRIFEPPASSR